MREASISSTIEEDSNNGLNVTRLLIISENFLSRAHKSVIQANNSQGTSDYFRMVTISIKALLILIKNYPQHLDPTIESSIYLKLSKIYFTETEDINKADYYVNRAISVASRNHIFNIRFKSEFLAAQILEKTNSRLLMTYINDKIQYYDGLNLHYFSNFFKMLKINNLFLTDHSTGLIVLQQITSDETVDPLTKLMGLLKQGNLHLYRGSPALALNIFDHANSIMSSLPEVPIQIKAMHLLSKYCSLIQLNDISGTMKLMKHLNTFIANEYQDSWSKWREDGIYKAKIPHGDEFGLDSYEVNWLNSDEFVILFYINTGVALLDQTANNKARKVFDKCVHIIQKQLKELTHVDGSRNFPLNQLTKKIIKLNYLKYQVNYYQVWVNFSSGDNFDITPLNEFMSFYNSNKFTSEEMCYYKLLLPKIFYAFAIYYQSMGDFNAAKYYFMKVCNYLNATKSTEGNLITSLQFALGIGSESLQARHKFSDLYVFSALHLWLLCEYEMSWKAEGKDIERGMHGLRMVILGDLNEIFAPMDITPTNSFTVNFVRCNWKAELSFAIVDALYNPESDISSKLLNHNFDEAPPLLKLIGRFLLFKKANDLNVKTKNFEAIIESSSNNSLSGPEKILTLLAFEEYLSQYHSSHSEKSDLIDLKSQALFNSVHNELDLLRHAYK